jgi:hypothetical protein
MRPMVAESVTPGTKSAVRTRGGVGFDAADGFVETTVFFAEAAQVHVGAGIDEKWEADSIRQLADTLDFVNEYRRRFSRVFDVHAYRACVDDGTHSFADFSRGFSVAGFEVYRERNVDHARDATDRIEQTVASNVLSIGIAVCGGESGAGGCNGGRTGEFEDPGAGGVPGIKHNENFACVVKLLEGSGFCDLGLVHGAGSRVLISGGCDQSIEHR